MQEKSLIKQNILQFIDYKGITKYKFYQKSGITRGVLDQNNGMSEENTTRFLACYPEVNPTWLLTGKGSMLLEKPIETSSSPPVVIDCSEIKKQLATEQERLKVAHEENGALKFQLKEARKEIELLKNSGGRMVK